jgi:hypothetical protein
MKRDNRQTLTSLLVTLGLLSLPAALASANIGGRPPVSRTSAGIYRDPGLLVGPQGGLHIRDGVMVGRLAGGAYDVRIEPGVARGRGPLGTIDVRITRTAEGHQLDGLWNGGRIDLIVTDRVVRGRVVRPVAVGDRGYDTCRYDIGRFGDGAVYSGTVRCLQQGKVLRVEVHPRAQHNMTDPQNVLLLVADLTAPSRSFAQP